MLYRVRDDFWNGFGLSSCPSFAGKSLLEIGCGHGNRCLEAIEHGAIRVVGLDVDGRNFAVGRSLLATAPASWRERITFFEGDLGSFPPEMFDIVLSENTFEHVMNVPELLAQIKARLNPGGRLYVGFGPLYHGPDGDHGWLRQTLPARHLFPWPWGHLLLKRYALSQLSELHSEQITRTYDWPYLDLNQHTVGDFVEMFRTSGLRTVYLRTNHVKSLKARIFTSFARLPFLSRYFTLNIFAILESTLS
jgi:SAM-dependent methyltransferase